MKNAPKTFCRMSSLVVALSLITLTGCNDSGFAQDNAPVSASAQAGTETASEALAEGVPIQNFNRVNVLGKVGNGFVSSLLSRNKADFGGTASDAALLNVSSVTEEEAVAHIQKLKIGSYIIVEANEDEKDTSKLNRIMFSSLGFELKDIIAYGIYKNSDGKETIVPLYSKLNEKGEITTDQITQNFTQKSN